MLLENLMHGVVFHSFFLLTLMFMVDVLDQLLVELKFLEFKFYIFLL